jgi:predicted nucleotidyltransferase
MKCDADVKDRVLAEIKGCLWEKGEVKFVYVLGTFLNRDDFRDIDVALYLDERKVKEIDSLDYEMELSLELEERIAALKVFERYVPVDAKVVNRAPVTFRYSVSKGTLLFCRDEEAREEFICRTWQEYFDFRYILDRYYREVIDG